MKKFWRGAHRRWEGGGRVVVFLISLLIGIGLFILIGRTVGWPEIKKAFLVFTGWQGIVIFLLTLLITIMRNWVWKEVLKGGGVEIPFGELFKIYLAGLSIRFLAPVITLGDEIFQSYALKERNSLSWSKGAASVAIERILEWTTNLIVIFFGVLFFFLIIGLPPKNLAIFFGGLFTIFALGIFFFYFKTFKRESIVKFFIKFLSTKYSDKEPLEIEKEIFNFFKMKNRAVWKTFFLSFFRAGLMWLRTWLLVIFLGENIGALPALSILGFTYLAVMIPIPTALGSHEAIQTFAFNSLGLGIPTATAFTMIIRGAELLVAFAGLILLYRLGISLLNTTLFKKYEI